MTRIRHLRITEKSIRNWASTMSEEELDIFCPWEQPTPIDVYMAWLNAIGWKVKHAFARGDLDKEIWDFIVKGETLTDPRQGMFEDVTKGSIEKNMSTMRKTI
jgi:hypothetical protein